MPSEPFAVTFGLGSAASWGVADFAGGVASKRANVFLVVLVAQGAGLGFAIALAAGVGEPLPSLPALGFGVAAGIAGGIGVVALYRALAIGRMGVAAPVTGVLAAGIPVAFGAFIQGLPPALNVAGFALAIAGVCLLSRPDGPGGSEGLGLAIIAGTGFGAFLILFAQIPSGAFFWPLVGARAVTIGLVAGVVLFLVRGHLAFPGRTLAIALIAGVLDMLANALFLLAAREGRLDVAAVLSSLYPAFTTLMAFVVLKERLTRLQTAGMAAALAAIPLIAA